MKGPFSMPMKDTDRKRSGEDAIERSSRLGQVNRPGDFVRLSYSKDAAKPRSPQQPHENSSGRKTLKGYYSWMHSEQPQQHHSTFKNAEKTRSPQQQDENSSPEKTREEL